MQPIKVKFNYTEKEYLTAARMLLFGQRVLLARLIIILALVWFGIMTISLLSEFEFPLWAAFWIGLLVDVSFVYLGVVDAPRRLFRKDAKMREEFVLKFSERRGSAQDFADRFETGVELVQGHTGKQVVVRPRVRRARANDDDCGAEASLSRRE